MKDVAKQNNLAVRMSDAVTISSILGVAESVKLSYLMLSKRKGLLMPVPTHQARVPFSVTTLMEAFYGYD
jgi:hypothetical protein